MLSVVLCTFNREHLLARSLRAYASTELSVPLELIVLDDDSTDNTLDLVRSWARDLDIKYIRLFKAPGVWRDAACLINIGLRTAKGGHICATHPEVIVGRQTLRWAWDNRKDGIYQGFKVYYLSPGNQDAIDTVAWWDDPLNVRTLPGFYSEPSTEVRKHEDYSHEATDRHTRWDSWVFGAMTKKTWREIGGFSEYETWGSADVAFMNRRRILQIGTDTPMDEQTICLHQNHDVARTATDVLTPRDMDACMNALPRAWTPENARLDHV